MKTILITGINGFLGSQLSKALSKEHTVIGLEYSKENVSRLEGYNFPIYETKDGNIKKVFEENTIDVVIHTATIYRQGEGSVRDMLNANVLLPIQLYELANKFGIKYFLNTDSFFNDPTSSYSYLGEYTLTKKHALEWLKTIQNNTKLVNMKIFHMYGPHDAPSKFVTHIIEKLKSNVSSIDLTPGEQKRDFIYIEDVVSAYAAVIGSLDKIEANYSEFELGTGKAITLKEFVLTAAEVFKSTTQLNFGGLNYREGEIMFSQANTTSLTKIGWKSKYKPELGLKNL